jgi:S-adenosylmethionine/arginine decarboxylase-like enzyme
MLVRAYVHNPPKEEAKLNSWLTELVSDVKMKVVVPAKSKYVEADGNQGLTGSINIETSHMAIHIWDEESPAKVEMDLYSCACFEKETVLKKIDEWNLEKYHLMMVDRNEVPFKINYQSNGYEVYNSTYP